MATVKISEKHNKEVEELQKGLEERTGFKPTKKQIIENAIEKYRKEVGE